ncbi:MAG: inositol monophosphatase [Odoribacter sp.]|nr:inositol monophosphatase [Odoribacter sp.]
MDLKNICRKIEVIAAETAAIIMKESGRFNKSLANTKGLNDFVSYVDLEAEKMLVEKLGNLLPEAGFIVEEGTSEKKGLKYNWIVDPLDGTTNFLHKIHPFAISIALREYDEVIAGVVFEAGGRETFTAWSGGGAWLNGNPVEVSSSPDLSNSLIATGFPYKDFSRLENYLKCLEHLLRNSQGVRRMGSASIDMAYVACGRFEAFFEYALKPWDVAAGTILIREAGGLVSDFEGNGKNVTGLEIVAANNLVYNEFLEIVSKFMVKR